MESGDSKAGSRCNRKTENNISNRPNNHDIDEIGNNKETASDIGIANEDKVNGNEEKTEGRSFDPLVSKNWKDETESHPNTIRENREIRPIDTRSYKPDDS